MLLARFHVVVLLRAGLFCSYFLMMACEGNSKLSVKHSLIHIQRELCNSHLHHLRLYPLKDKDALVSASQNLVQKKSFSPTLLPVIVKARFSHAKNFHSPSQDWT